MAASEDDHSSPRCSRGSLRCLSALSVRLDVASEVIENRLPALALLLDRIGRLAVECNAHFDTSLTWDELDLGLTIPEGILDQLRPSGNSARRLADATAISLIEPDRAAPAMPE